MAPTKSILVVDDDPAIHALLQAVLASPDWQVEAAQDGQEALSRVRVKDYDLVLTDVRMPGMDGLELLRTIHEERPATRVLVMTADNTPDNVLSSLRRSAFAYFSKPFSSNLVRDLVQQALAAPGADDDIRVRSALPNWVELEMRCRLDVADRLVQFLKEIKMDLPETDRENIAFAFREMLRNAVEHGGKCDPNQKVEVAYIGTSRASIYYIRDPGEGFRFTELPHAAISNPPDLPAEHMKYREEQGLRPGGFGILLTKNMVDELIYNERGNEVILIKYLS